MVTMTMVMVMVMYCYVGICIYGDDWGGGGDYQCMTRVYYNWRPRSSNTRAKVDIGVDNMDTTPLTGICNKPTKSDIMLARPGRVLMTVRHWSGV